MTRHIDDIVKSIAALDLDPIKMKLMDDREGEGWSQDYADAIERQYRQFLVLSARHPDRPIVPTKAIDTFWHQHILDTRKYAEDCERVFGYFLHHFPYFGMRGEQDARDLEAAFAATLDLVAAELGEGASWDDPIVTQCRVVTQCLAEMRSAPS